MIGAVSDLSQSGGLHWVQWGASIFDVSAGHYGEFKLRCIPGVEAFIQCSEDEAACWMMKDGNQETRGAHRFHLVHLLAR